MSITFFWFFSYDRRIEGMDTRKNLEYLRLWLRFNVSERVSREELEEKIGWITDAIRALALLDVMESGAE